MSNYNANSIFLILINGLNYLCFLQPEKPVVKIQIDDVIRRKTPCISNNYN